MKANRPMRFRHLFGGIFLRMAAMFLVVLVFSSSIILFFMNNAFRKRTFDETLRSQNYSMRQMTSGLSNYLDSIDQLTLSIIYDSSVQSLLVGKNPGSHALNALLTSNSYQDDLYIMLVDSMGNVYHSTNLLIPRKSADRLEQTELYAAMQDTYAALYWDLCSGDLMTNMSSVSEEWMLTAGRQVRHLELNVAAGCIVVQVLPSSLAAQMQDPLLPSDSRYLLLDRHNHVIYDSFGELRVGDSLKTPELLSYADAGETSFFGQAELGDQLYVFGSVEKAGLRLISCLPSETMFSSAPELFWVLLKATALGFVIALTLALMFSLYFSRPIMEIVLAMRKVRNGDFSVRVQPRHSDELGELAYTFNVMTKDMDALVEQTKRDQRDLKSAEFNALIYQINPHFIYNTLDNVNMLARLSGETRMSVLITELSSLLRITLSGGQEVIAVKRELKHVGNYLRIMQLRNEDLFNYEIRCQEGLEEVQVLKVILQPLAENAIRHGFEYIESDGFLRVSALSRDGDLVLRVEDNGMGMDQYDANRLMEELEQDRAPGRDSGGIGLRNVWHRLRIYYGENGFRMRFGPSELGGLMVEMVIYNQLR